MNARNFLNLRPRKNPEIVVVKKEILKPRSVKFQMMRMLFVVPIVTISVWGISNADEIAKNLRSDEVLKHFSTAGYVSEVTDDTFSLEHAKGEDPSTEYEYTFDLDDLKKIETNTYDVLSGSDIQVGDKVIVQGVIDNEKIIAKRLISFSERYPDVEGSRMVAEPSLDFAPVATTTATTTDEVATSTLEIASTTETAGSVQSDEISTSTDTDSNVDSSSSSSENSSSGGVVEEVVNVVKDVVDAVADIVQEVVDQVTGDTEDNATDGQEQGGADAVQGEQAPVEQVEQQETAPVTTDAPEAQTESVEQQVTE